MSDRRYSPLREITLGRVKSFLREPEALFWTFVFPIMMAIGLGLAFGERKAEPVTIGVERGSAGERYAAALRASDEVEPRLLTPAEAEAALRKGEVAVVLAGRDTVVYRYDPAREESRVARLLADQAVQRAAGAPRPVMTRDDRERTPGSRYIDWVIPGLIGLNLMSTGMWGTGFGLVQMRSKKQLKRLSSTPMRKRDFLLGQILGRMVFLPLEVAPIVLFALLAFGVEIAGSVLLFAGLVLLGAMAFSGLGLLASSRARTIEGVSGILNVVMLPMFVLSGVFFSSTRFPEPVQPFVQALPLTAMNDALRGVYNEGAGLAGIAGEVGILAAWTVVTFALAVRLFRWQ